MPKRQENVSASRLIEGVVKRLAARHKAIDRALIKLGKFIDFNPRDSRLKLRLQSLRATLEKEMNFSDVLKVATVLKEIDLEFWIAGGWGIDVLAGFQSRKHEDVDIVIDDFQRDETKLCSALSALGYVHRQRKSGGFWMPTVTALSDKLGRRIEFMSIDWDRFATYSRPSRNDDSNVASAVLRDRAFAEGAIFGQKFPCLSRNAQLLFH